MKTYKHRGLFSSICLGVALVLSLGQQIAIAQVECNYIAGSPANSTGSIAVTDTAQTLRLFRDGRGTTCTFNRVATTSAGNYLSDQYSFTNNTGAAACVFVDLDTVGCGAAGNQLGLAAYSPSYNPASILTNLIADPGLSSGTNLGTSMAFNVPNGGSYVLVVHNINAGTTCASYTIRQSYTNSCRQPGFDQANDGSADLAVFRPSGGLSTWYSRTIAGAFTTTQFGSTGDGVVAADYSGDEATDVAVFRPSSGVWYTSTNPGNNYGAISWGVNGDIPVPGDYDRDGINDVAVFRPSNNNWYILRSGDGTLVQITLGQAGDKPVPADYDGDGKTDPAVYRPSNGLWTTISTGGVVYGNLGIQRLWGNSTDIPVPADYDGDSRADTAVYRPSEGNWYIFRSSLTAGNQLIVNFGTAGDIPQPADYDGDKSADFAVFRPSTGIWYLRRSTAGDVSIQFGQSGDVPASSPFTSN